MMASMRHRDRAERRLTQLLSGTSAHQQATAGEVRALVDEVDMTKLVALLKRLNMLVLIGGRVLALGVGELPELEREVESHRATAHEWGVITEFTALDVLDSLEHVGIRAMPLKGSSLARQLYGDVAARTSRDIDILVAADDLPRAVTVVQDLGWRWRSNISRPGGLPLLHETLVHSSLPRIELHWRLHWYERRFAAEALARAERCAVGEPLRMQPLDGLIALMLFYARDGFTGLRFPADAATWWDVRCAGSVQPASIDAVAERYPELAAPVRTASRLLAELVGVPTPRPTEALPFRWRVAAGLGTPFKEGGRQQAEANAGLADVLLTPPGAARDAMGRVLHNAPAGARRSSGRPRAAWTAVFAHLLRVGRRWLIGIVPAVARSLAPGRVSRELHTQPLKRISR